MTYPTNIPLRPDCGRDVNDKPCVRYQGHFGDCMPRAEVPDDHWSNKTLGLLEFDQA